MRRTNRFFAAAPAASVDLPPTPLGAALLQRRVLRLVGGPFGAVCDGSSRLAGVFTGIIESSKKCAAVPNGKDLARAGRAAALFQSGCLDTASDDLAEASKNAELKRMCSTLAVRITQAKLTHALRTSSVSGADANMDPTIAANLASELIKSVESLSAVANAQDFVPVLLAAEAALNTPSSSSSSTNSSAAVAAFNKLNEQMFDKATAAKLQNAEAHVYATLAHDAQRAFAAEKALASSNAAKIVGAGIGSPDKHAALTLEEAAALYQAAAWHEDATIPINVLDMGDAAVAGYGPGAASAPLLLQVGQFLGLLAAHNAFAPHFAGAVNSITAKGTHDVSRIEEALSDSKTPVVESLAGFDVSRLSMEDDAFTSTIDAMDQGYSAGTDFANLASVGAVGALGKLEEQLLKQARSRAHVGHAAALASAGEFEKADVILDEVINENSYVEIWRAFLMKGNVAKKLGNVEQSDMAFRSLHALKQQPEGRDLPLRDKYRDISAF